MHKDEAAEVVVRDRPWDTLAEAEVAHRWVAAECRICLARVTTCLGQVRTSRGPVLPKWAPTGLPLGMSRDQMFRLQARDLTCPLFPVEDSIPPAVGGQTTAFHR